MTALWLRTACFRASLLALGWWALSAGEPSAMGAGVPIVAAATIASLLSNTPRPLALRPWALLHLVRTFLADSVRGGWDVARLALAPRLALTPVIFHYDSALSGAAQRVFTSLSTLVPGTLTTAVAGRDVCVHALVDRPDDMRRDLDTLEDRVARVFDVHLDGAEPRHA